MLDTDYERVMDCYVWVDFFRARKTLRDPMPGGKWRKVADIVYFCPQCMIQRIGAGDCYCPECTHPRAEPLGMRFSEDSLTKSELIQIKNAATARYYGYLPGYAVLHEGASGVDAVNTWLNDKYTFGDLW